MRLYAELQVQAYPELAKSFGSRSKKLPAGSFPPVHPKLAEWGLWSGSVGARESFFRPRSADYARCSTVDLGCCCSSRSPHAGPNLLQKNSSSQRRLAVFAPVLASGHNSFENEVVLA